MHSTSTWSSLSERCSGLPCMRWQLWPQQQLQQLRVVLVPILLLVGRQRWSIQQQCKASLVASWFVCLVHTGPSAVTDANPQCR